MTKLSIFLFFMGVFYTIVLVAHTGISMFAKRMKIWHVAILGAAIIAEIIFAIGVVIEANSTIITAALGILQTPLIVCAVATVYYFIILWRN